MDYNISAMTAHHFQTPLLITRATALRQLVDRVCAEPILAVDTESNSLFAYREQVCLIQFSTPQEDFLVDPLALDDLSPLGALFADPKIEKVFHAAEYDLITMKRDFGFAFANLFDTMLAARILGWEELGLGSILKTQFNVQLDKRHQRANWGQRPLPAEMLDYARQDTHYLIPLRFRLKSELKARDRWPLAVEDFNRMCFVNGRDAEDTPEACWRVSGVNDLDPQQTAVLLELCRYRDQVARSIDRPVFKVISDQALLAIAAACPGDLQALELCAHLNPKQSRRHAEGLLHAVQRGLEADPIYPPRQPRPDEQYLNRLDALRRWRKMTGQQMGVSSDVVLPRDLLYALARRDSMNREAVNTILAQVPWRLEHFGDEILNLLK